MMEGQDDVSSDKLPQTVDGSSSATTCSVAETAYEKTADTASLACCDCNESGSHNKFHHLFFCPVSAESFQHYSHLWTVRWNSFRLKQWTGLLLRLSNLRTWSTWTGNNNMLVTDARLDKVEKHIAKLSASLDSSEKEQNDYPIEAHLYSLLRPHIADLLPLIQEDMVAHEVSFTSTRNFFLQRHCAEADG